MEMMTAFGEIKQSKCYTNNLGDVKIIGYNDQSSSDGCLEKWRVLTENGEVYWLKSSSLKDGEVLYECESECMSSRLAHALGYPNIVNYNMDIFHFKGKEIKVCSSKEFNESDLYYCAEVVQTAKYYEGEEKYQKVIDFNPDAECALQELLLFDILIGNSDRHLNNIAYDFNKQNFLLFDNGAGLLGLSKTNTLKLDSKISFKFNKCKPFFHTAGQQLELIDQYRFNPVKKEFLHDLVYTYLDKKRAKWVLPWLISNFEKVGEYFEFPVFS